MNINIKPIERFVIYEGNMDEYGCREEPVRQLEANYQEAIEALREARQRYESREDMSIVWIQDIQKLIEKATGETWEQIKEMF